MVNIGVSTAQSDGEFISVEIISNPNNKTFPPLVFYHDTLDYSFYIKNSSYPEFYNNYILLDTTNYNDLSSNLSLFKDKNIEATHLNKDSVYIRVKVFRDNISDTFTYNFSRGELLFIYIKNYVYYSNNSRKSIAEYMNYFHKYYLRK